MTTFLAFVLVIVLCRLKLHIMRACPSHPCHDQVCRNEQCPCRTLR